MYCGACKKFMYEDIDGYGYCGGDMAFPCRCSDKCHLENFKKLNKQKKK